MDQSTNNNENSDDGITEEDHEDGFHIDDCESELLDIFSNMREYCRNRYLCLFDRTDASIIFIDYLTRPQ